MVAIVARAIDDEREPERRARGQRAAFVAVVPCEIVDDRDATNRCGRPKGVRWSCVHIISRKINNEPMRARFNAPPIVIVTGDIEDACDAREVVAIRAGAADDDPPARATWVRTPGSTSP